MLEILGSLIRQVVFIVLLAVLAEMLMPPGDLARFVRLAMGLFVVAAMLGSLSQVLPRLAPATAGVFWPSAVEMAQVAADAASLERYRVEVVKQYAEQEIAAQVAALLGDIEGLVVQHVTVGWEGEVRSGGYPIPQQLEIELKAAGVSEAPEALGNMVRQRVARFYNLKPADVTVRLSE